MSGPVYATSNDVTDWFAPDTPLSVTDRVLARASRLVRRATINDLYDTDTDGKPTDAAILAAFRDAVCTQVETWQAAAVDPAAGAVQSGKAPVSGKSIGSASVSYDTAASASVTAMTARANAATQLCDDAVTILRDAGLASPRPSS